MNIFYIVLCSFVLILYVIFPDAAIEGGRNALSLWASGVAPALFPFMVLTSLLASSGSVAVICRPLERPLRRLFRMPPQFAFILASSFLAGYPTGAKLVEDCVRRGELSRDTASVMVCCTSTSGPMFIVGSVCTAMLGSPRLGTYMLLSHYAAAIVTSFLCARTGRIDREYRPVIRKKVSFSAGIMTDAISGSVRSVLTVCGTMMLFGSFVNCVMALLPENAAVRCGLAGLFELATGCGAASALPLPASVVAIGFMIGFGGLSVHFQTMAVCKSVRPVMFFLWKLVQGAFSALFTYAAFALSHENVPAVSNMTAVFHPASVNTYTPLLIMVLAACIVYLLYRDCRSTL